MRKLTFLLTAILMLALILGTYGCGGNGNGEGEETPTLTVTDTPPAEVITLKVGFCEGLEERADIQKFADLVEEYTNGLVEIVMYPNSMLFPADALWEATVTGSTDMYWESGYYMSQAFPDILAFFGITGLFESREHGDAVLQDGRVEQLIATKLEDKFPVKMLGLSPGEMMLCYLTKDREITHLQDLAGLKGPIPPGYPPTAVVDYSGMVATPVAIEEWYTAFVQGVVDAINMTADQIVAFRLYEMANHMYVMPGAYYLELCAINNDVWNSLPADVQDIIENQVWPEMMDFAMENARTIEEEALDILEEEMDTYHEMTPEQYAEFWEATKDTPMNKTIELMVDKEIMSIIEELRPSAQ
jgi:TRAP-type C4-dicarboxylate transport system substrate-binding protein